MMRIHQDVNSQNPRELLRKIEECLEVGVTTFDQADIYGDYTCEALLGAALAERPNLREQIQLISKCGCMLISHNRSEHRVKHYDTSRRHLIASAEDSLRNLHTDYLDLFLIHRPDPLLDADEVAEALTALRAAGKVRHCGVSNFLPWQFDLLQSRLDFPLVTNQIQVSVLHMNALHDGSLDQCQRQRIVPMAWSPLGGNALFFSEEERVVRVRQVLQTISEELGAAGIDQVALAWVLQHPSRPLPVLGTNRISRIHSLADAEKLTLTRQQWFAIWEASAGHPVP
jgi:predicted oxidoreductase